MLCALLLFLLSNLRGMQVPFFILGAMLQISAVLLFLSAGMVKMGRGLMRKIEEG